MSRDQSEIMIRRETYSPKFFRLIHFVKLLLKSPDLAIPPSIASEPVYAHAANRGLLFTGLSA